MGNTDSFSYNEQDIFEVSYTGNVEWSYSENIKCARALKYSYDYFNNDLIGDINQDQVINILDCVQLINLVLMSVYEVNADLNTDAPLIEGPTQYYGFPKIEELYTNGISDDNFLLLFIKLGNT